MRLDSPWLLRFIFESFENTYLAPSWWEGLQEGERSELRQRMQASADPATFKYSGNLLDDELRCIDWSVTNVFKHP
jgi:hypothetical protein